MHKQHMNIEKFSNIKDFMLLLTVNTWPSRLSLHFRNHLWLHLNFVKFVALKCYVLHFESRRAAASPASVCPLWVRGCDGLMVTLLTLLSLHWEAAGQRGWAALDCVSVSPCHPQLSETCYWSQWSGPPAPTLHLRCKPNSLADKSLKSPLLLSRLTGFQPWLINKNEQKFPNMLIALIINGHKCVTC